MPRAGRPGDEVGHPLDLARRQPRHDLVEQDKARTQRQRARNFEPLEQANGQVAHRRVHIVGQSDVGKDRLRAFACRRNRPIVQHGAQRHVLHHRQVTIGLGNLKSARDAGTRGLVRLPAGDRPILEHDLARGRCDRAGDQVVERALAGAVRSDQADKLPLPDREADPRDRGEGAERTGQLSDLEQSRHGAPLRRRSASRCSAPAMPLGKYSITTTSTAP